MAFRDSINDLMFRFYERFKQNNNRLPVSVDADINVGDVQIGTVKQGGVDEGAEPWKVKAEELEQKIDALKQSIESGVQLKGSDFEIPVSSPHDSMFSPLGYEDIIIPIGGSGEWDEHIREIGNVVHRPGFSEQYVLVYTGHQGAYAEDNVSIGLATSSNGKTWTKKGPLNLGRAAEDPYLVYYNGMFYLYVEDKEVKPARNIRLYTSTDLSTWLDRGDVLHYEPGTWEAYDVSSPTVWIDEGVWYMLYEGRKTAAGGAVGLAISTDGINWQKHPDNPVITAVDATFSAPYTISWASAVVPDDIVKIGNITYATVHVYMGVDWVPGVLWSTDNVKWWDYLRKPIELPLGSVVNSGTVMFSRHGIQNHVIYARNGIGILQLPIVGFRNRHLPVPLYDPGRRIEPFYLAKNVEVRTTSQLTTHTVDISRYRSLEIWVRSTLDQPITLAPTIDPMGIAATGLRQYVEGEWRTIPMGELEIPVHTDWHPLSSAWAWLNNLPKVDRFRLRYSAHKGAPTTGSLTILAVGEV